jgi:uncharacterized glyoxalase superfamily protein PhnB
MAQSTLIPCLAYQDAAAAIRWLCDTFGFTKRAVYEAPDGKIMHSELSLGGGMIMVGSHDPSTDYGRMTALPREIGGRETMTTCIISPTPDELYRRAKAGGAKILRDIRDESYGGRSFICSDPEGHIWSVGSYDPWAAQPQNK